MLALTTMATGLGVATVAEGVENEAQGNFALALGCRSAQGWLFAAAMSPDDVFTWVGSHSR